MDARSLTLRQTLDQRLQLLRSERSSYLSHWIEVSEYILPRRGRFLVSPNQGNRGSPRSRKIIDSSGGIAARDCAAGMMAGITSPARPWFRLTLRDRKLAQRPAVKVWLDDVTDALSRIFADSNFYNACATVYEELTVFGSAPLLILEDKETVINCFPMTAGEYYLGLNGKFRVDTLYREFTMTVWQLVSEFGLENCSDTVQGLYRSNQLQAERIVIHAIEPNDTRIASAPGVQGAPYRSVYYEWGSTADAVLRTEGFWEWPAPCPRWHVVGNDAYGRSPGMEALPDIKQLQHQQRTKAKALDKQVDPPLVGDAALQNQPASILPGGITYVPGGSSVGFKPVYQVEPDLRGFVEDIRDVRERVNETFFRSLFLAISQLEGQPPTAEQIREMRAEKLLMIGPVLTRFQQEFLGVAIERTFAIAHRGKLLPPAPPEIHGMSIDIDYVGDLAQAQKAIGTTAIEQVSAFVGNLAAARPDALDKLDIDEMIDEYADRVGVSPKIIVPTDQANQNRAARAKQAQQQQQMEQSLAAVQGAKTLSETDVGGGQNALQRMMGGPA